MTTLLTYNLAVQAFDERDYRTAVERFSELLEAERLPASSTSLVKPASLPGTHAGSHCHPGPQARYP